MGIDERRQPGQLFPSVQTRLGRVFLVSTEIREQAAWGYIFEVHW